MTVMQFDSAQQLMDYVVTNSIAQNDITKVLPVGQRWYLFTGTGLGPAVGSGPELADLTSPPAAPANGLLPFSMQYLGESTLHTIDADGNVRRYDPSYSAEGRIGFSGTGGGAWTCEGLPTFFEFATGTITNPAPSTGSALSSAPRRSWTSSGSNVGAIYSELPGGNGSFWRGNAAALGGFRITGRVAWPQRTTGGGNAPFGAFGLISNTGAGPTFPDPAGIASSIFVGFSSLGTPTGDNDLEVISVDSGGTATRVTLSGAAATPADSLFEISFYARPNASSIWVRVVDLDDPTLTPIFDAAVTSTLPSASAFLQLVHYANTASSGNPVQIQSAGVRWGRDL